MKIAEEHILPHKMYIVMNKQKLQAEKVYSYGKIMSYLDKMFFSHDIYRDSDGWYAGGTFEKMGAMYIFLSKQKWFLDNVKQWLWYDGDFDELSDVLEHIRTEKRKGSWTGA